MTEARIVKYRTNLQRKMSAPGGSTLAEAVRKAEAGVEARRGAAMQAIDGVVAALEAACVERSPDGGPAVYALAAGVVDMAGFYDTGPFHTAAFSLCEIAARMNETGRWDWPSVQVHVRALRLILQEDFRESEGTRAVLDGLEALCRRTAAA